MTQFFICGLGLLLALPAWSAEDLSTRAKSELSLSQNSGGSGSANKSQASVIELESPPEKISESAQAQWSVGLSVDSYRPKSSAQNTLRPRVDVFRSWNLTPILALDLGAGFSASRQSSQIQSFQGSRSVDANSSTWSLRSRIRKSDSALQPFALLEWGSTNLVMDSPNSTLKSNTQSLNFMGLGLGAIYDLSTNWDLTAMASHQEKLRTSELEASNLQTEVGVLIQW